MTLFDTYDKNYRGVVQSSIDFSGLPHSFFYKAKADMVRELVTKRLGGVAKIAALDVGCGIGMFHPFVRDLFGRLCGVDASENCIAKAQSENPGVEYKAYMDHRIPYDAGEFDISIAICVMHHVLPADWVAFLRDMARVTRPGGIVCIIEHNPLNPLTQLSVRRCEFDRDAILLGTRRMERLMGEARLRNIDSNYFLLLPSAAPPVRRIERWFARAPFGAQYMSCGEA